MALEGIVFAVSIDSKHRFSKILRLSVTLVAGHGIEGDAHYGQFVKHRYLTRRYPRSPNLRQVHLISSEMLNALRVAGYDVGPGELGENITTTGLDLETLPLDTRLRIGTSACILLTGLRSPCVLIDRFRPGLKSRLVSDEPGQPFTAGVMAIVTKSGDVSPGDAIRVILPATPHRLLPPL
ncbi:MULTISPECIES: MOSC domain-containing protein [Bradyrhizobium]|uniref:MOSC domain-containing protein n=1 Tax=Bradyrhizobium elkanii TaxID=29448 RepID=A0A4U6RWB9_BRAEL|nr:MULTISPECIES: MOSC domain-containing protein [Bradyrhizobium]MTV19063.1 MOSC domain-containing protein [Bradyrhizobium sp. BR2003]TKV77872.1 MOSC domain-containing protein [Bradyrhizobium elkanii]